MAERQCWSCHRPHTGDVWCPHCGAAVGGSSGPRVGPTIVECKFCQGTGGVFVPAGAGQQVCPGCRGAGVHLLS